MMHFFMESRFSLKLPKSRVEPKLKSCSKSVSFKPGSIIGDFEFFLNLPCDYTVLADTNAELMHLSRNDLQNFFDAHPSQRDATLKALASHALRPDTRFNTEPELEQKLNILWCNSPAQRDITSLIDTCNAQQKQPLNELSLLVRECCSGANGCE